MKHIFFTALLLTITSACKISNKTKPATKYDVIHDRIWQVHIRNSRLPFLYYFDSKTGVYAIWGGESDNPNYNTKTYGSPSTNLCVGGRAHDCWVFKEYYKINKDTIELKLTQSKFEDDITKIKIYIEKDTIIAGSMYYKVGFDRNMRGHIYYLISEKP